MISELTVASSLTVICVSKSIGLPTRCQRDSFPPTTRIIGKHWQAMDLRRQKISVLIDNMTEISRQLVAKLAEASQLIRDVLAAIESPKPVLTEEMKARVKSLVAARKCLNGAHDIPAGDEVVRGMCRECYNAAQVGLKKGDTTEDDLVARGLLTGEKSKGGRKRTLRPGPLRDLLEGHRETVEEAAAREREATNNAMHAKTSARNESKARKS
jgi:hypothetical protein